MKTQLKYKCPYCGVDNTNNLEIASLTPFREVFYCENLNVESGGCGKDFVATVKFESVVTTQQILEASTGFAELHSAVKVLREKIEGEK